MGGPELNEVFHKGGSLSWGHRSQIPWDAYIKGTPTPFFFKFKSQMVHCEVYLDYNLGFYK